MFATIVLQLDDECLSEAAKWMTHVPNVVMSNNEFGPAGMRALAKLCRKHEMGKLRSLNFRFSHFCCEMQWFQLSILDLKLQGCTGRVIPQVDN